jgi:hypothetical protein
MPTAWALTGLGLLALHRVCRTLVPAGVATWSVFALLAGSVLWRTLLDDSPTALVASAAFALSALSLWLWWRAVSLRSRVVAAGVWLAALGIPYAAAGGPPRPWLGGFAEALFSSSHGLLFGSPLLWLGLLGLAHQARRRRGGALAALAAAFIAVLAASGASGAGALAGGRLHVLLPILGVGLAWALEALRALVARRPAVPVAIGGAALTAWNFLFMEQYRTDLIPRDLPVSFADVTENNAALLSRRVGSPTAWPANWLFAARYDVSPAKYDVVVGQGGWRAGFLPITDVHVDPHLLAEGWGGPTRCGDAPCRTVAGSARILLPLGPGDPTPSAVRLAGPTVVSLRINDDRPFVSAVGAGPMDVPVPPSSGWRRGVNEIAIAATPPGEARVLGLRLGS